MLFPASITSFAPSYIIMYYPFSPAQHVDAVIAGDCGAPGCGIFMTASLIPLLQSFIITS